MKYIIAKLAFKWKLWYSKPSVLRIVNLLWHWETILLYTYFCNNQNILSWWHCLESIHDYLWALDLRNIIENKIYQSRVKFLFMFISFQSLTWIKPDRPEFLKIKSFDSLNQILKILVYWLKDIWKFHKQLTIPTYHVNNF